MSETFLHNPWVTVFYVVTWPVALGLFVTFGINAIEGPLNVSRRTTATAIVAGALLFVVGLTAGVSGVRWEVVR